MSTTTTTSEPALDIQGLPEGAVFMLKMKGAADLRDSKALTERLFQWHHAVLAAKSRELRVDVRAVEFMNSTALGAFVAWIGEVQKLTQDQRYRIRFDATQERRWQRSSLHALASFAPELISVTYV